MPRTSELTIPAHAARTARPSLLTVNATTVLAVVYTAVWLAGTFDREWIGTVEAYVRWAIMLPALLVALPAGLQAQHGFKSQIAFLAATLIASFLAPGTVAALAIWARILMAFLIVRGMVHLSGEEKRTVQNAIYWTLAIMVVLSLLTWAAGSGFANYSSLSSVRPRIRGISQTSGMLGYMAALLTPWAVQKAFSATQSNPVRIVHLGLALCGLVSLIQSDSRSGMVAVAISLAVIAALPMLRAQVRTRPGFAAVSAMLTIAMMIGYSIPFLIGTGVIETRYWAMTDPSSQIRFALWESGVADFLAHPLKGQGLGSLIYVYASQSLIDREIFYHHSALLNYFAKCGLFAGLAYAAMIHAGNRALMWSLHCFENRAHTLSAAERAARSDRIADSLILVIVTIAFSITEAPMQNIYPSFLFFFAALATLPVDHGRSEAARYGRNA